MFLMVFIKYINLQRNDSGNPEDKKAIIIKVPRESDKSKGETTSDL